MSMRANPDSDTDIVLRYSDNNGSTWTPPRTLPPIRVSDDTTGKSQFQPRIATNPETGKRGVLAGRPQLPTNDTVEEYCSLATPTGAAPTFLPNFRVSAGASLGNGENGFGDYAGLTYLGGGPFGSRRFEHPIWSDTSGSSGNADQPPKVEAYTNWMSGEPAISEGNTLMSGLGRWPQLRLSGRRRVRCAREAPTASRCKSDRRLFRLKPSLGRTLIEDSRPALASMRRWQRASGSRHIITFQPPALSVLSDGSPTELPH